MTETVDLPNIEKLKHDGIESGDLAREYGVRRKRTDLGNAERFADRFGAVVRWDSTAQVFRYWDGSRWIADPGSSTVGYLASLTVRSIYSEATMADDADERQQLGDHAKRSESASRIKAMLELVKSRPELVAKTVDFDADRDSLNVGNGIVNLRTGELRPHDPAELHAKLAPVNFRPELLERESDGTPRYAAESKFFAPFVAQIAIERPDWVTFMQRLLGYGITGHAREQILSIWVGDGGNGKSALASVLRFVVGDYWQSAPPTLLIDDKSRGAGASPELARLTGVRLLEIQETNDSDVLAEGLVKWITGNDRVTARPLYGNFFEFDPQFLPVLTTNHKPRIRTGGHSMWRRLRLVPFDFRPENPDAMMPAKLESEAELVLAWLIDGSRQWYAHGLADSSTIEKATSQYRSDEDSLAPFLADRTVNSGSVHRSKLYKSYRDYCDDEGTPAMGVRRFNAALRERGFKEIRDRVYENLSLLGGQP